MKKYIFLIFAGFFLANCSNEEIVINNSSLQANSCNKISEEQAIAIANSFKAAFSSPSRTNSTISEVVPISANSSRSNADTLIYAINYDENSGFVLVSAKKGVEPIIGYVEKGSFNAEHANENVNFQFFLEQAKEYIHNAAPVITDKPEPIPTYTTYSIIPTRLEVAWGQYYPEGYICPNHKAGCGPVAMLQAFSYLEEPEYIELSYPNHDIESISLNWDELKKHTTSLDTIQENFIKLHLSYCKSSKDSHLNIARLCRELGHLNNAIYKKNSTSTTFEDIHSCFYNISSNIAVGPIRSMNNYNSFYEDLEPMGCIALVAGNDLSAGGHAWICDGARRTTINTEYEKIDGSIEVSKRHTIYLHYSWGWCGDCDGYFLGGVYDTTKGQGSVSTGHHYNLNSRVRYFIVKKK